MFELQSAEGNLYINDEEMANVRRVLHESVCVEVM